MKTFIVLQKYTIDGYYSANQVEKVFSSRDRAEKYIEKVTTFNFDKELYRKRYIENLESSQIHLMDKVEETLQKIEEIEQKIPIMQHKNPGWGIGKRKRLRVDYETAMKCYDLAIYSEERFEEYFQGLINSYPKPADFEIWEIEVDEE